MYTDDETLVIDSRPDGVAVGTLNCPCFGESLKWTDHLG